ncbi:MAG: CCA tRNA nucleotidyltransferase [Nitrososphaeria archaeon]
MQSLSDILEEARKITTPKPQEYERADTIARLVTEKVSRYSKTSPFNPKVIVGGSYARDTWLPENADIDVFLSYPLQAAKADLETDSYRISCQAFGEENLIIRYAEHPYVETNFEGARVNIVPCYNVKQGQWVTAADRSPYHLKFMQDHLSQTQKGDVRLLKKFMKASGTYGAEIKVRGFSGYMCEVLIYRFKSFRELLADARRWKPPLIITDKDKQQYVKERFPNDKVVVTDPIDVNRNLGRALSIATLSRFILSCRSFTKEPKLEYFIEKEKTLKAKWPSPLIDNLLCIYFEHDIMSVDILWGMLNHTIDSLTKHFERSGFKVIRSAVASDDKKTSAFIFLFETMNISSYDVRLGPEIFEEDNVQKFTSKNKKSSLMIWVEDDARLRALKSRDQSTIIDLIKETLKDPTQYGVSRRLVQPLKENHMIVSGREVQSDKRKWVREALSEMFEPKDQEYLG